MRVLISGGAGLIGTYVTERLLDEGYTITVIDHFSKDKAQYFKNLQKKHKRLYISQTDVTDIKGVKKAFSKKVDWVFHFAGVSSIQKSLEDPLTYYRVNVNGALNMLEAAREAGVKRFIYAASASCYGSTRIVPTPEDAPIQLETPYALTKYLGEQYTLHWGRVYKLPVISLRFFSVYGSAKAVLSDFGPVFRIFVNQVINGLPVTIRGSGRQSRDFLFVTDAVDACVKAARSNISNEVFNVGSGKSYSMNTIARLLKAPVKYIPGDCREVPQTRADIRKISKFLHWKPHVSLEMGIERILHSQIYRMNNMGPATRVSHRTSSYTRE